MSKKKKELQLVVGVGASAGGLTILKDLTENLPSEAGIAYVIIQHLDPDHKSMLSGILDKNSSLPVQEVSHEQTIETDHVYVIPSDTFLEVSDGKILLVKPTQTRGFRKSIDHFFRSLADHYKDKCAGLVLSGTGSDGTAGLRAIKAAGGLALVQDPETAEHSGMPISAIQAGVVDKVTTVDQIPVILQNFINHPLIVLGNKPEATEKPFDNLEAITAILRTQEDFNLQQYKPSTVKRRISRRMGLTGVNSYDDYLEKLRDSDEERSRLTRDLLINVTDFFRDHEAFDVLENKVLPNIVENVADGDDIRIWVAGCASGEEAYSIAISLMEVQRKKKKSNPIKIFATDIDEDAIKTARKGVYPESIAAEVPKALLDKYFKKSQSGHHYKIINRVRDRISFASQNVAIHPPFSHMHLISCRNLLIYLKKEIQQKILGSFYFSIEKDGYLFLGSSEAISSNASHFKSISRKWRIFQKVPGQDNKNFTKGFNLDNAYKAEGTVQPKGKQFNKQSEPSYLEHIRSSILNAVVPPMIIIGRNNEVLYNHGNLRPFTIVPAGEPRNDISQVVYPAMRSKLRSGLFRVRKSSESLVFHCNIIDDEGKDSKTVKVELVPLQNSNIADGEAIGVIFNELPHEQKDKNNQVAFEEDSLTQQNLELELAETKEELQNTLEELESSTEELKASHEEALSTNEELQSANEELEASSEELRSLNEELSTVNAQLREKIDELKSANDDVENFFASTNLPTIFLDPELNIQRYTPAAEHLLKMGPQDIGRPIFAIGRDLLDEDLENECKSVLQNFLPVKKEKQSITGHWYIRQITPYKTEERRVEGVVLVFQDITELKELSKRAEGREHQQSVVAKLGIQALSGLDPKELMYQAVREVVHVLEADYCKVLKYRPQNNDMLMVAGAGWKDGMVGIETVPAGNNSQAGFTLHSNEPVIVKNLNQEKRFTGPQLLTDHGVVSGISCVINHTEPPYGVLGVHTTKHREFTLDDANFLMSVANMLSTAIQSKEASDKIFQSEQRFRTMANSIPQLAWMANKTGHIFWYNKRWYDYTGHTEEDMVGWGWQKVHHPDYVDKVTRRFKEHIVKGKVWEDTFPLMGDDGQYRWFLSRANPIRDQSGEITQWFGTNTDITKQRDLEASLKSAINKLEETDKRKNEFLAVLGHELRNPLAAIKGSIDILSMDGENSLDDYIDILQRSSSTMARLLDDLLDLSRISRNIIVLEKAQINLSDILKSKLAEVEKKCRDKNQQLVDKIRDGLFVEGDVTRVEQIFSNLVTNAHKFTPEGGRIQIKAWRVADKVSVEVADDGIGISEKDIKDIFDPFHQAKSDSKPSAGLGIGLSLVKNLTELHNGSVSVHSSGENNGTTFRVVLPAIEKGVVGSSESTSEMAASVKDGIKVVLVDDNVDIIQTQSLLFKKLGCTVFTADSADSGINLITNEKPDIAFVDLGLPDEPGYNVAAKLRGEGFTNKLVAVSGFGHKEAREKSEESGFDEHIAKPLMMKDIRRILAQF